MKQTSNLLSRLVTNIHSASIFCGIPLNAYHSSTKRKKSLSAIKFHSLDVESIQSSLSSITAGFPIKPKNITILNNPNEFYKTLVTLSSKANERIYLSSLYLGCGSLEQQFVSTIKNRCLQRPDLAVQMLFDYHRATRPNRNNQTTVTTILPLLDDIDSQMIDCSLFCLPRSRLLSTFLKGKYSEVVALHHMKIYIFDDHLIISGANLEKLYFTTRQDRYILIKDEELANFYCKIMHIMKNSELACSVGNTHLEPPNSTEDNQKILVEKLTLHLQCNMATPKAEKANSVWIYPTIQIGPLGIIHDQCLTESILSVITNKWKSSLGNSFSRTHLSIALGYMNIPPIYANILVRSKGNVDILASSPKAMSFYGAPGLLGFIPDLYSSNIRNFLHFVSSNNTKENVRVYEYEKENCTYHAKGLWLSNQSGQPFLTMIGSPNLGWRSIYRDTETSIIMVTSDETFSKLLQLERDNLFNPDYSTQIKLSSVKTTSRVIVSNFFARLLRSFM